jgi:gluconate:H+ symporter, GntP family
MGFLFNLSAVLIGIVLIILFTALLKYNAFLSIFLISLVLSVVTLPLSEAVPVIATGFGNTMKSIGLIIILGIILGLILDKTRATQSIAHALLKLTGKENAGLAIHATGFVTGIPIFCDSGFIVLHGINRSIVQNTGKPMVFMATVLASGLYSVHCLIPPHPGATAAAGITGANIGHLIMLGIPVAMVASVSGFLWSRWMNYKEYRGIQEDKPAEPISGLEGSLPSAFRSFLPIVVPVLLLTFRSVILLMPDYGKSPAWQGLAFCGEPIIALLAGIILAVTLFKKPDRAMLNDLFDTAISKSGVILTITAAGGIFGAVIKATGIGEEAGQYLAGTGLRLLIPFLIAAFLKTAQGSSTVAVMTAASIVSPLLPALHLGTENGVLLATLAMGAGSMIVSHTNDSYFWVITKFSELEVKAVLRVYTSTTLIMGLAAYAAVMLASVFML